jgi:hypothetical protein
MVTRMIIVVRRTRTREEKKWRNANEEREEWQCTVDNRGEEEKGARIKREKSDRK